MEQATPFLTIFGGTGDLVKVKIAKAITTLFEKGYLTDDTVILGVAFDDISETEYRQFWQDSVYPPLLNGKENPKTIPDQFLNRIFYKKVGFDVDADFDGLKLCIDGLTREAIDYNRMFYYAVWSDKYVEIARNLSEKGIISTPDTVCSHYLEKPIGNDLISAENCLNGMLNYVDTNNLFLIDHYLGKEAVRDLLVLLFENLTTYPILTAKYVERVVIHAYEAIGVEDRGRGYDSVGALRDMWIPHLLQILALFAMDRPDNIEDIPTKKREALEKVIRIECNEVEECAVFGQYSDGVDDEDELTAYRQEDDVDSKSLTETYCAIRLFLKGKRWKGVKFDLKTGKRMGRKETGIWVYFKAQKEPLFFSLDDDNTSDIGDLREVFNIRFQPFAAVTKYQAVKAPGDWNRLSTGRLRYSYEKRFSEEKLGDYETLLREAIFKQNALFVKSKSILESWKIGNPFVEYLAGRHPKVYRYSAGYPGPVYPTVSLFEAGYTGVEGLLD